MTGADGEYGEGFNYLRYVNNMVLPVLYIASQEQYTFGTKKRGTSPLFLVK